MTDEQMKSAINVLRGLNGDGQDRLQEAEEWAVNEANASRPRPLERLAEVRRLIAEGLVACGCSECGEWDGLHRRCSCGNRRVVWGWDDSFGWYAEVY
jgi:ribosomal protein L32